MVDFVHLHVHSQYSMLDGAIRLKSLISKAKDLHMPSIALTDHGNMFGALQFFKLCKGADLKPILGCEVNMVVGNLQDVNQPLYHLVLIARSQQGYQNLTKIVSQGWVEGCLRGVPRISLSMLEGHTAGIVGLSGCMGGYLSQQVLLRGRDAGRQTLDRLRSLFEKDAFFVELQDHSLLEQKPLNKILASLAKDLEVPLVATNDCHYLEQSESKAQLILQCIGAGALLDDVETNHHGSSEMYLKPPERMVQLFSDFPEAIKNTILIAEMCGDAANPLREPQLPRFALPSDTDEATFLKKLSEEGLRRRFAEFSQLNKKVDEQIYHKQLLVECDVICSMGFAGYFLIVQDFINWAKERGIPVGPGRGSGAGSIVAYALRITDLDPIQYGLLFERFLNPERVSMPDFDIDFCMDRRDEVIEYVRAKYGRESVGQIATFHLLKSRSVVRDVGRVMKMTPQEAGRIATLVPEPVQGKSVPIASALEQEKRLKTLYDENKEAREVLDTAMSLEELTRHAGMHAAGIVISEGKLWDHVPVFCPEPGEYVTQYSKDDVEEAGLVKFDFLGLKTLTVIDIATKLINRRPEFASQLSIGTEPLEAFDINRIPLNDRSTFALLQSGETTGVFQLESSGMQALFKQLKPDCFEDIVAAVALYRPGPLGSGMVEDFVQRKHKRVKVEYPHPCLENVLKETYGVIVYQEQVMQAAQVMAGYSLGKADLLRRAMGKKKPEEMAKQKAAFIEGAVAKSYDAQDAEKVFELINYFSGYGFNKSHSAAYAMISYQTAYLKAHYPVEFITATLTADKDKQEKVVRTVAEARSMGIVVLPPDVNQSDIDFTVVYDEAHGMNAPSTQSKKSKNYKETLPRIRFGLGAVKGVGAAALEALFEARHPAQVDGAAVLGGTSEIQPKVPFTDLFDFAARVDLRRVNKSVFEALVQSGAFDAVHTPIEIDRAKAFASIEIAIDRGRKRMAERNSGQTSLFGAFEPSGRDQSTGSSGPRSLFVDVAPWDSHALLEREKVGLGFFVSGHPLDRYRQELLRCTSTHCSNLQSYKEGDKVRMGGIVEGYRERPTRSGGKIAFFILEDQQGRVEVVVRPQWVNQVREVLEKEGGKPILISGSVQFEGARGPITDDESAEKNVEAKLVLEEISPLVATLHAQAKWAVLKFDPNAIKKEKLVALKSLLHQHAGPCPVDIEITLQGKWSAVFKRVATVEASEQLTAALERMFGAHVCELRWPQNASNALISSKAV